MRWLIASSPPGQGSRASPAYAGATPFGHQGEWVRPLYFAILLSHTVLAMHANPGELFEATKPDVVVDFTNAEATPRLLEAALEHGVRPVIGTSGISDETLARLRHACTSATTRIKRVARLQVGQRLPCER